MASTRSAGLDEGFGDPRAVTEIDLDLPEGGWMASSVRSRWLAIGSFLRRVRRGVPIPTLEQ